MIKNFQYLNFFFKIITKICWYFRVKHLRKLLLHHIWYENDGTRDCNRMGLGWVASIPTLSCLFKIIFIHILLKKLNRTWWDCYPYMKWEWRWFFFCFYYFLKGSQFSDWNYYVWIYLEMESWSNSLLLFQYLVILKNEKMK